MRHDPGLKRVFLLLWISTSALAAEEVPDSVVPSTYPAPPPVQFGGSAFPSWEYGGGYNFVGELEEGGSSYPVGWNGSIAKNLNEMVGIVGEVTGNHDRATGIDTNFYSFLGGIRFSFRGDTVTPFFSVLGGVTHSSYRIRVANPLFGIDFEESANDFTFLGGGGVDVTLAGNWALRAGADLQSVFSEGDAQNLLRIQAGVLYRSGASSATPSPPPLEAPARPAPQSVGGVSGAPLNEISVEYAFLRELDEGGESVPFGWNFSYARNFSPSLGIVGEVGTAFETEGSTTVSLWDFMGGVRFSSRGRKTTFYGEALGGLAYLAATGGTFVETVSKPAVQGGGGVDFKISESLAIRGGADYRAIFAEGEVFSQLRLRAGVVFGFGGTTSDGTLPAVGPPPPPRYPEPDRPAPPPRERVGTEPQPPEPMEPVAPLEEAEAPPPPPPLSDYERGQTSMQQGDFELAAVAFMVHLRQEGSGMFTVAVGLFCDRNNVAAHVVNSGYAPEFFILSVPRGGQTCFGAYFGLYDSREQAQAALEALPPAIRAPGQVVLPVSRIVR